MTSRSLDWVAGLFEGEGCFTKTSNRAGNMYLRMHLGSTDEDVIRTFHETVYVGSVHKDHPPSSQAKGHKPQWRWAAQGKEAEILAIRLVPLLHSRRQARLVELLNEIWGSKSGV